MAKIGRNAPCPCGSRKKYKKCCGSQLRYQASPSAPNPNIPTSPSPIENSTALDPIGLPGTLEYLTTRPRYRNLSDPRNSGGPEGLPGYYEVIFTLSRPGFPLLPEYERSFAHGLKGDSHLAISKPAYINPEIPDVTEIRIYAMFQGNRIFFRGIPNETGFLGRLHLPSFYAESLDDASIKAHRILMPALSGLSLYLDIPLHIYQEDIKEIRTGTERLSMINPFQKAPMAGLLPEVMTDEFKRYASYYREALNSETPHYQFLCYFKIIEGLRYRQARLIREAKQKGENISSRQRYVVPQDLKEQITWLNSIFPIRREWDHMSLESIFRPEAKGRKVNDIIDKELTNIRIRIAHAILDSGEPTLSIDDSLDIAIVYKWLPLTKCFARLLLKDEFPDSFRTY